MNTKSLGRCRLFLIVLLVGGGLVGCAGGVTGRPVQSRPFAYDPAAQTVQPPNTQEAPSQADGSLWQENAPLISMFSDQKARAVGDIVTIKIVESSEATNEASTDTDRTSSMSASVDAFFNAEKKYSSDNPFFNPFSKVAGGLTSEFGGSGTTKRSGDLEAYITALVTQVLPNGNLVLTGSREVLVNNENQVIQLSGVVRPRDITADNQVLSTYIADARISYSGSGVVNDRQRTGWMSNILMTVWPF
ncbi:flagellar basal body L-ring protein FlgH [Desulfosarcina ovata]|nr:flagellar basal body L-ring protein FlgH [Desulfosarcina ovata]